MFDKDEGPRADTSPEALARLKPAFKATGTVTAGNASQMSDGAAAVLVCSRAFADEHGLKPLVRYVTYNTAGLAPEVMGMGPVYAVPKALESAGLKLEDIDLIELNEAFAAQSLAVIRELGVDTEKTNVNGGAVALGHPLGCTGAKLTTQAIHEIGRRGGRYAMVTMCVGGAWARRESSRTSSNPEGSKRWARQKPWTSFEAGASWSRNILSNRSSSRRSSPRKR